MIFTPKGIPMIVRNKRYAMETAAATNHQPINMKNKNCTKQPGWLLTTTGIPVDFSILTAFSFSSDLFAMDWFAGKVIKVF